MHRAYYAIFSVIFLLMSSIYEEVAFDTSLFPVPPVRCENDHVNAHPC